MSQYLLQIFKTGVLKYMLFPKSARENEFKQSDFFTCSCIACREDWPLNAPNKYSVIDTANITLNGKKKHKNYDISFFSSFLQLKKEFDNERTRREIDAIFERCEMLSEKAMANDFEEDKEKTLMEYYKTMKFIYERVVLPCGLVTSITGMIDAIISDSMGDVSLGRLLDM